MSRPEAYTRPQGSLAPPSMLPHNPEDGVHRVLAVVWGEVVRSARLGDPPCDCVTLSAPASDGTPRPDLIHRGAIRLPKATDGTPVKPGEGGRAGCGVKERRSVNASGLWASVKLGHKGRLLAATGHTGISLETDEESRMSALALVPAGWQAFS